MLLRFTKTLSEHVKLKNGNCSWMSYELWTLIKLKKKYLKKVRQNLLNNNLKEMHAHVSKKVDSVKRACKKS